MTAGAILASAPTYSAVPYGSVQTANSSASGVTNSTTSQSNSSLPTDSYRRLSESPMAAPLLNSESISISPLPQPAAMREVAKDSNTALYWVGVLAVSVSLMAFVIPAILEWRNVRIKRLAAIAIQGQLNELAHKKNPGEQIEEMTDNLYTRGQNKAVEALKGKSEWAALQGALQDFTADGSAKKDGDLNVFKARVLAAHALEQSTHHLSSLDPQEAQTLQHVAQTGLQRLTHGFEELFSAKPQASKSLWKDAHQDWKAAQLGDGQFANADDAIANHRMYLKHGPDHLIAHVLRGGRI